MKIKIVRKIQVFPVLNVAVSSQPLRISVPDGVDAKIPVHVLHISTGGQQESSLASPSVMIEMGHDSKLTVLEEFISVDNGSQNKIINGLLEGWLSSHSHLNHSILQCTDKDSVLVLTSAISQEQGTIILFDLAPFISCCG